MFKVDILQVNITAGFNILDEKGVKTVKYPEIKFSPDKKKNLVF